FFIVLPCLAAFPVPNILTHHIPPHKASPFVVKRVVTDEEPTILPILPQRSLFDFKRETARKGRPALLPQALEILRMKDPCAKVRGDHVFHGAAGIIEHCLVRIARSAVRVLDTNGLGYGGGNPAKLA